MNFTLLKELSEARGIPGQEENIRRIVRRELTPIVDSLETDSMGNLIGRKQGSGSGARRKVMIAAHMDEIGFIVKHIDDNGFLRLQPLGGFDPKQLFAQRMRVDDIEGRARRGVLNYAAKPIHLQRGNQNNEPPTLGQFFLDLGMQARRVKKLIRVGAMVTLDRTAHQVGDCVMGKCMDNRIGVFVMIEAMKKIGEHAVDILPVATVQEEIGLRGALTSAYALAPDIGIALDVTLACDVPGTTGHDTITELRKGCAIKIMDSSMVSHPKLIGHFREIAEAQDITHQMEILPFGGTDGGALQRSRGGIPSMTLSVPCRYVHTVNEMCSKKDIQGAIDLLAAYLTVAHEGNYDWSD